MDTALGRSCLEPAMEPDCTALKRTSADCCSVAVLNGRGLPHGGPPKAPTPPLAAWTLGIERGAMKSHAPATPTVFKGKASSDGSQIDLLPQLANCRRFRLIFLKPSHDPAPVRTPSRPSTEITIRGKQACQVATRRIVARGGAQWPRTAGPQISWPWAVTTSMSSTSWLEMEPISSPDILSDTGRTESEFSVIRCRTSSTSSSP